MNKLLHSLAFVTAVLLGRPGIAQNHASISECTFSNGHKIAPCKIAYRTYGKLNAAKDNVVLISTWLLGRSEDWAAYSLIGQKVGNVIRKFLGE